MPDLRHSLTELLGIPGFRVMAVERRWEGRRSRVVLRLTRTDRTRFRCSGCGQWTTRAVRDRERIVQHLTWWEHITVLRFWEYRVNCPSCGLKVEALPWLPRYARVTTALAGLVAELCQVMSNNAVAVFQALHRDTVKAIDKAALRAAQQARSLDGITVLGMDEIAVGKGHHDWTLISALEGPRGPEMLYVVEGRTERRLTRCGRWFGTERAVRITHAVIDMCRPFENSIRAHCRTTVEGVVRVAQLIDDKFPVMRHLNDALNTVRKSELRRALGRFKQTLAGKKFVLLTRRARVRGKAREALDAILAASPKLLKAHLLKESFGRLWDDRYKGCARRFWAAWKAQLKWQRLPAYRRFVRLVERHLDGILAYCEKRVSLGYIESANLKARNVIRRAYGYRDKEYMKLKIIQACTPWMAQFDPWKVSFNNSA